MISKPKQPTARERYQSMLNGGFRLEDDRVDFLIKLVEAAVAEAKEYCERMHEDGFVDYHRENDVWEGINQRLAEGKKS